ncbi:hypothetical protein [uncultured Gimesia sp.]|uniref:hypothetical protein n=1 Tax=uncultured Gimesia sp. TaxID=1678688 RepID=UPI0030DAA52B|tara:strand:- start:76208 stop:82882 length:6675 start_codon:yes stop_codon:yes gene_type:complete
MRVTPKFKWLPSTTFNAIYLMIVGISCCLISGSLSAAENGTFNLSPSLRIKEVTVSGRDTSQWPEGNWYPVPLKKYQSLKNAALLKKNTPPNSWIQDANYIATLKGDHLIDGRLEYVLHCSRNEPGFIDLSKLNLAIHELKWGKQDAVWGVAPDQQTLLLVDHFGESLKGQWSLKGRQLPQRTEFSFKLPETVVSRVQLNVPRGMMLTTSVGYVLGPSKSDLPEYDLWQIELGGQSEFQAIIYQSERQKQTPTQILYHQFAQVGIREDGLRLREDFQIEVLNQPVQKLEFEAPAEYEIYSVTLGNDLALPFEVKQRKGQNLVTVDLIDPLLGISRPLSVRALASSSLEGNVTVPRLKLKQAHFLGGTVHLDISAPLQTHAITSTDLRQTGVLIQEEQGEAYDFKQYTPDARLQYRLALPDLNLSARVHSVIQVEDKVWNLKSRIHWASAAGTTYRLEAMIPAGWEITQVNSLVAEKNSGDLVWDVEQSGRQQKLSVRLPISVSPETPYSLEIQAKRLVPVLKRPIDLFGVRPLGCDNVDRILELATSSEVGLLFDPDKEVEELAVSELPKNWDFPVADSNVSRYFHLSPYSGARWGALNLSKMEQTLQVVASTFITINDDRIQENFILNCVPARGGIQRVLVYLSEAGEPVEWSLPSGSGLQSKLSTRKLPVSEHQNWELPHSGELWELTFSAPVFREIEIRGERRRPFQKNLRASLAYTPQAKPIRSVVRILNSNELNLRIQTEGLSATSDSASSTRLKRSQRNYEWDYEHPSGSLTITRASDLSGTGLEQGVATIIVDTKFGHGNGEPDVHQATIELDLSKTFDDKVLFHFPAEVKLISTAVNQQRVTPIEAENHFLVPLFDQLDSYRITIQYQTASVSDDLSVTRQIPFPQINQRVLETDWNFSLPEGMSLLSGPEDMVLQQAIPTGTLTRRFFGVLGKDQNSAESAESRWNAIVLFPVKYGTLKTSNTYQAKVVSWIVLLSTIIVGLFLRILRVGIRDKLCIILALVSLALAWIFPLPLAQIAGSCFTGILIAMLIPRRFLRQEKITQIEDQSTKAYQQPTSSIYSAARMILLGVLCFSTTGYAQKLPAPVLTSSATQSKKLRTEMVLLPDTSGSTAESFAYLTPDLLQELETLAANTLQPEYLISSAHYDSEILDNQLLTVKATFRVKVPIEKEFATIQLPVSGGNLSGPDSCRVDGNIVPVLLGSNGQGILVNVTNQRSGLAKSSSRPDGPIEARKPQLPFSYQDHQIELILHPAVKFGPTSGQFEIGIPPVAINQFTFQCNDPMHLIELTETTGVSKYQLAGKKQFSSFLKENPILKVKWLTSEDSETTPLNLEATVLTKAEVSPSLIRMEVQVNYTVLSGKVDVLFWKFPAGAILRSVKSAGITVVPTINSIEQGASKELLLELSESKTGEFMIDATFDLPANDPLTAVKILPVDFGSAKQNPQSTTVTVVSHQIGVSAGPEFEIEPVGTLPEGVLSISSKISGKQIDDSILKSSALLFQVTQPAPISLVLRPKNPKRSARINQTIVVNRKNIDWTFAAELRISQAPAFRHTIIVPQGFRIESLSVKEEDVERLAHWHRIGNRITLFLKNKTSGLQDITLKGWLPIRKLGSLKIPGIQLQGVEIEESLLSLYNKPQLEVQLTSPQFRRIEDNSSQSVIADHFSFVGRFQKTDSTDQPISLLVKLQKSAITVDTLTIINSVEDQQIEVTQSLRFTLPAAEKKKLKLLIPAEYGNEYSIDGMPFEIQDKMPDGLQRVELQPTAAVMKENTVTVRATFLKPASELIVVPVTLENSHIQNNYLLLSTTLDFQLTDKKPSQTVLPDKIPSWVQARCDASSNLDCSRVYTASHLPWKLSTASRSAGVANEEFIPYLETEIILSNEGTVHGLTQIKLFNQNSRVLNLDWPEKSKLMAVLINGEIDSSLKPESGKLVVPLNGGPQFDEITLFWESYQVDHQFFLEKAQLQIPQPNNFSFDKNLIKIIASDSHRMFLSNYVTPFTYFADKLDEQLKIAELELEMGEENRLSRSTWDVITKEFAKLELIVAEPVENGQGISEELNRFDDLKERVFDIKQDLYLDEEPDQKALSFVHQFQQKLGPVPLQKVRYYSSSGDSKTDSGTLLAWIIPKLYLDVVLAGFCLIILLPILGRCVQSRSADWLDTQPAIGLIALGILWMLFLTPQYLGLAFIALAIMVVFKNRQSDSASANLPIPNSPGTHSAVE